MQEQTKHLLPLHFDDGRVLSVDSIACGAHRDANAEDKRNGWPAVITLRMQYPDGSCDTLQDYKLSGLLRWDEPAARGVEGTHKP